MPRWQAQRDDLGGNRRKVGGWQDREEADASKHGESRLRLIDMVLADHGGRPLTRALIARASEIYAERFADPDGRLPATFEIITLTGWAPHESQPKPLARGSAKASLADVLGVKERSAGEKAGG